MQQRLPNNAADTNRAYPNGSRAPGIRFLDHVKAFHVHRIRDSAEMGLLFGRNNNVVRGVKTPNGFCAASLCHCDQNMITLKSIRASVRMDYLAAHLLRSKNIASRILRSQCARQTTRNTDVERLFRYERRHLKAQNGS